MSLQPFLVEYAPNRGMHARIGGDPELASELENLGVGMETEGEWALGGPFVWQRSNGARVIGWIRGVAQHEIGRAGAFRAWGVQADGEEKGVAYWPYQWDLLKSEPSPERLDELAAALRTSRAKPTLPKLSDEFAELLSEAWRRHARGAGESTLYIPLEVSSELPALAWFWLVGPEDPSRATLGPPRRAPAAVAPPLTYAGRIGAARPRFPVSPWVKSRIVQAIKQGTVQNALNAANELRAMPLGELAAVLDEPPRKVMTMTADAPMQQDEEPAPNVNRDWITWGLAAVQIALLLAILWKVSRPREATPQDPIPPVTTTTAPATTTTVVTTPAPELAPEIAGVALLSELKKPREGVKYANAITAWIRNPNPSMTRSDVARARTAALQLYFRNKQCSKPDDPIDGTIGPGFYESLQCLGRNGASLDVLTNDQRLIDWLQQNP